MATIRTEVSSNAPSNESNVLSGSQVTATLKHGILAVSDKPNPRKCGTRRVSLSGPFPSLQTEFPRSKASGKTSADDVGTRVLGHVSDDTGETTEQEDGLSILVTRPSVETARSDQSSANWQEVHPLKESEEAGSATPQVSSSNQLAKSSSSSAGRQDSRQRVHSTTSMEMRALMARRRQQQRRQKGVRASGESLTAAESVTAISRKSVVSGGTSYRSVHFQNQWGLSPRPSGSHVMREGDKPFVDNMSMSSRVNSALIYLKRHGEEDAMTLLMTKREDSRLAYWVCLKSILPFILIVPLLVAGDIYSMSGSSKFHKSLMCYVVLDFIVTFVFACPFFMLLTIVPSFEEPFGRRFKICRRRQMRLSRLLELNNASKKKSRWTKVRIKLVASVMAFKSALRHAPSQANRSASPIATVPLSAVSPAIGHGHRHHQRHKKDTSLSSSTDAELPPCEMSLSTSSEEWASDLSTSSSSDDDEGNGTVPPTPGSPDTGSTATPEPTSSASQSQSPTPTPPDPDTTIVSGLTDALSLHPHSPANPPPQNPEMSRVHNE